MTNTKTSRRKLPTVEEILKADRPKKGFVYPVRAYDSSIYVGPMLLNPDHKPPRLPYDPACSA